MRPKRLEEKLLRADACVIFSFIASQLLLLSLWPRDQLVGWSKHNVKFALNISLHNEMGVNIIIYFQLDIAARLYNRT